METKKAQNEISLETIVSNAIKVPGVKVKRDEFLAKTFSDLPDSIPSIVESGPIDAGVSREQILKKAKKLIAIRTSESSVASFAASIPSSFVMLAMIGTIPADIIQFFALTLRLAQELTYLYGAQDLWSGGEVDDERVRNQLILYCGVMFGVSGASAGVRVLSSRIADTTLLKLPQKALTKTFWYPLVKKICAAIGVKVTKTTVSQGISKAIPVVGGVISGGLTFASMMPMANRLLASLDKAAFDYTEKDLESDIIEIESFENETGVDSEDKSTPFESIKEKAQKTAKVTQERFSGVKSKIEDKAKTVSSKKKSKDAMESLKKLKELLDIGAITEEEYESKKSELMSDI